MSETRHEAIAELLTEEILRGRYQPGDRLPSERDLAQRFETNRGSVREAEKKLGQLGLVDVQPGGTRVLPIENSSLEVVGRLMALDELPDPELLGQVLDVVGALMQFAAETAMARASEDDIAHTHALVKGIADASLSDQELMQRRMDLGQHIMAMSGNLVLRMIARTLHEQVVQRVAPALQEFSTATDSSAYIEQLDRALDAGDRARVPDIMQTLARANKDNLLTALRAALGGDEQRINGTV